MNVVGYLMFVLAKKPGKMKRVLRTLNKHSFGNVHQRVSDVEGSLA